jgi:hypothetical protein
VLNFIAEGVAWSDGLVSREAVIDMKPQVRRDNLLPWPWALATTTCDECFGLSGLLRSVWIAFQGLRKAPTLALESVPVGAANNEERARNLGSGCRPCLGRRRAEDMPMQSQGHGTQWQLGGASAIADATALERKTLAGQSPRQWHQKKPYSVAGGV